MRVNGIAIKLMARDSFGMLMAIFMKANGSMTKLTVMGSTSIRTALST